MALINVKNAFVRRVALVLLFVPLFLLSLFVAFWNDALVPLCKEMPDVCRNVWRGKA